MSPYAILSGFCPDVSRSCAHRSIASSGAVSARSEPFPPSQKFLPDGKTQDLGEFINIDMTQVPAKSKQSVRKASIVSYPRDACSFASDTYP